MKAEELVQVVLDALEDVKGRDIEVLDVRGKTSVTDILVIASGTSTQHVKSLAGSVVQSAKDNGVRPLGVEGDDVGEWVLVDLGDVVAHVMLPAVRDFYELEKLWSVEYPGSEADEQVASD